jgi:carbon storage regulator
MLVLTRKLGECIYVGDGVKLTVIEVRGQKIRLGIDAPPSTRILRSELVDGYDRPAKETVRPRVRATKRCAS